MSVHLLPTVIALAAAAPAPIAATVAPATAIAPAATNAAAVDTTPEEAARDAARRRAVARRDSLRRQIARLRAACGPGCDSSADGDDDFTNLGRVVSESVTASMRGTADALRRAGIVARRFDFGPDYEPNPRELTGPTRLDTTVAFARGGAVDLALVSGTVTVTAWDRPEVRVRGQSDRLPFRFERTDGPNGGTVRVYTVRTRNRSAGEQQLDVTVPVGTRVTANSISGNVRVHGVRGELDAETVSGDVDVQGAVRRVSLTSMSGSVHADALDGEVRAHSVSGDVRLTNARGEVDANSVSGNVDLRLAQLGRLRARTVSGNVSYDGTMARDGRYDLDSQSGDVRLVLPADAGAALSVQTFSGSIESSIPLTLQATARGTDNPALRSARRLEFTVGGGGARVTAQSFSGTIVIVRATTPRN